MTERNLHENSGIESNNQRHDYNEIKKAQAHYQEQLNSIQNSLEEWELLKEINQKIHRYIEKYPLVGSDEVEHLRSEEIKQLLYQNQQRNRELALMPELRQEIPKKIHFVWLGKLGTIQQEYIRTWNEINKGENYTTTIWYDKNALLVHELNKRIKTFAKKINQLNFTPDAYANAVIVIQNQAYQKITEALERGLTFDQACIDFIRDDLRGDEQELRNIKKQNQASFDDFIRSEEEAGRHYRLQSVEQLFHTDPRNPNPVQDKEIQIQQKNYQLELALRQNMAAASDMLRLKVLEQQGGGYFDADFLPAFKSNLWENMEIPAVLSKSDLNDKDFNLAKTQLVLEHLSEFFPHRKVLFDSNKYQDYAKSFAKKGPDYKKLIDDMRIFLRGKGNTLSDFFQPLRPIKLHPDGILVAKNRDNRTINGAIFSHPNSETIKTLQQKIGNNYRFLRNHDLVFVDNTDVINDHIKNYMGKIPAALWKDPKTSTRINGEIGNMSFRKDGVVPGSQATIFLSGPEMLDRRIKSYSEQMFGQQRNLLSSSEETSFFISGLSSDCNNFTEENMVSSWIQQTEASSQTLLIKRSDQLKEWSALGIENKPHQGNANQEKLYNDIRHHFDTLFLENTDKKLLKNIFSLQLKIQSYINKYPKFPSVTVLKELKGKIHNILFPDTDFKRNQLGSILLISTIDLEQAARIYISIHDHNKHGKAEPNINALIFSDPYLQPFKGFTGEENDILQGKQGVFNAKFHIPLGNRFTVFKANLLAAQAQNVLNNVYLDEKTKIAHIGYSYNELTALKRNEHVGIILYTIILAIQEKKDSNFIGQTDLLMLKHFSNRRYLQDIRKERLADINKIGKSDPNTEIAEWDKQYSGQTGEQLQQRLLDKDLNINSWLDVLLENRKGLLISENNYGLDFVTRHLLDLKSKGITTIGLGVLNAKFAQPLIDDYLRTGNLSGELAVMVETNGLGKLFESAFAKKMKIVALGVDSRRKGIEEDDYENIYRIDKTNQGVVEAFNQPGEKFVAILSSEFLQSQPGIEGPLSGITHRLGLPALTVNESGFTWLADNISQRKAYQPLSLNSIERSASFPHFSVTVDPGYQNILFTLDELHARVSNSGKINTACQLHQEIQQYIQRNPDSELNSRLITLKRQIDALFPSFDLPLSPGRGQKRKMLPAIFDSHGSREGKATPNQLSINAPSGQLSALGENTPATVKNTDVEHWQKPGVTIKDDGGDTAYDGQIVIQIEDDPIAAKAAADLAGKHPNTLLVQLDLEGNYHLLHGDAAQLGGKTNLRVQLVGHGRDGGVTASHITMGGQNNQQLAHHLNSFFDDFKRHSAIDIKPARIVLAGCSLVDLNQQNNFAEGFIRVLNQEGVSVTAYSADLVVADDGHRLIVDSEGNTRSARQGKIIYHRDQKGNVRAEISANLPTKLHWVAQQLDQLASGSTVKSLGCAARTMLQDAFHLSDGQLDRQKLLLSAHSPENRQGWDKATRQLLQDPATYNEQANLSVQAALAQQQHSIQQQQQRSREFFQAGEKTQKAHPRVEINAHLIPPWYSLREGIDTRRDSDAWSLAFLDAKQAGKTQYDIFSAGLAADAVRRVRIIEESASGAELADSYHLHSQFKQLKNSAALSVDNPTIFTRHNGQDLFGATPAAGAYLLKGKYHSVALHIHQDESAGYRYSLYDPQVGSFDLTALSTGENRPALHSLLDSYLQGKDSAGQTRAQQYGIEKTSTGYAFDAYRVNIEQARALTPLGELQTLLNNQVVTRNLLSSVGLMHRVNQVTGYAGSGMSVLGYYLGYKAVAGYEEALRQQGLTPEKRQQLEFERNLALFSVNTNLAVDIGQYGLSRMASAMSGSAAKLGGSMVTKARFIKVGGAGLSLVGVGMDIYGAYRSFSQLTTETDPEIRQDLIVSGSLSVVGAAVGLAVTAAFMVGGAAAAAAGPLGLVVGGVLMLVGLGYAAARQVEEIEKHIYLTVGEKWDTGWQVFWGNHPAKAIQDKMAETQRSTYREVCDQLLTDNAQQMVRKRGITPIYHYVYSRKDFDLKARRYWEFKLPLFSRIRKEDASKIREEDLDRERQALIDRFGASTTGPLEARITDEYYYTPVFKEVDDYVDGASGLIENAVRFDNRGNGKADGIVLFNLGDGKDTAFGYRGKRNTFLGGKGKKYYEGNQLNDTFYLGRRGTAAAGDFLGSTFYGENGEDTLIIVATPEGISGYSINLTEGYVHYRKNGAWSSDKVATLADIEHVIGHATLNDHIVGDKNNNQLNGQGGVSTLYGMGGNDVLTLEQGWADGGTEEDSYVILQNACAENAEIVIIDTGSTIAENNHVILKQDASQIRSITLVKKHRAWVNGRWVNRDNYTLRILLTNDNGTTTQLDLEDAYQRSADGTQLQSHHRYNLTTHDGVQIDTSSWPKTLTVADKKTAKGIKSWSLPVLAAQYVAFLDNRKLAKLSGEINSYSLPALKATIAKINTVIGDATGDDRIRGDGDNNQLNGQSGHSRLYGMGGNDILILEHGFADGGTEEDSYIILQNTRAKNAKIAIIDTGSTFAENNHLVLKQDAVQIQSITLMIKDKANESWKHRDNYTLRILLTNDNGTTTQLDLEDAYRISEDGKQLKLHNRYSVTTRDGLQIDTSSWPKTLLVADKTTNENGLHSWSLPVLAAQYVPIYDSKRSAFLASAAAEQSTIELIQKNAQGQSEITIGGQKTVLPKWMRLQLGDTGYNDTIEGDDSNNTLSSVQGNDSLKGKAGSDVYHLYHQPNISKTITIDNEDTSTKPDTDLIILHSVSMDQLNTVTLEEGGDLVLRAATPDIAVGILELRLRHFMQHQRYQHALILDKAGDYYFVEKGEDDRAHIYPAYFDRQSGGFKRGTQQDNLQKQATAGDDTVIISNAALLPENTFRALAGNDTVIDRSDLAITVYGGAGDDSLVVDRTKKGNKIFYGEAGNDFLASGAGDDFLDGGVGNDMLRGNQGHDRLEGGEGDDTYLYFQGDGNDVIKEIGGNDTLALLGNITEDNVQLQRQGNHLYLIIAEREGRGAGVIQVKNHFASIDSSLEKIQVAGHEYDISGLLKNSPAFIGDSTAIILTELIPALSGGSVTKQPDNANQGKLLAEAMVSFPDAALQSFNSHASLIPQGGQHLLVPSQ